ncbi:hypothetical protein HDU86_002042 [Geranomyces michiganensis]|nr:hypothetical protein HDU86_002042 [Geranomyces michiganensis]
MSTRVYWEENDPLAAIAPWLAEASLSCSQAEHGDIMDFYAPLQEAHDEPALVDAELALDYELEFDFRRHSLAADPRNLMSREDVCEESDVSAASSVASWQSESGESDALDFYATVPGVQSEQAWVDAHLALSYELELDFRQQLLQPHNATCKDNASETKNSLTATVPMLDKVPLAYSQPEGSGPLDLSATFRAPHDNEQALVDAHLALSYELEAAFRRQLQTDRSTRSVSHNSSFACSQLDISAPLDFYATSRDAQEQQIVVNAHLALSYELEAEFRQQRRSDDFSFPTVDNASVSDSPPEYSGPEEDGHTLVDAHLALSLEPEAKFRPQQGTRSTVHDASIACSQLEYSYLQEDEQALVDARLALSYELEDDFRWQQQGTHFSSAVDNTLVACSHEHEQGLVDAHLALSYELEAEFRRQQRTCSAVDNKRVSCSQLKYTESQRGEQAVADAHLALSYELEAEFRREQRTRSAESKRCDPQDDEQAVADAHLALSYQLEAEFRRQLQSHDSTGFGSAFGGQLPVLPPCSPGNELEMPRSFGLDLGIHERAPAGTPLAGPVDAEPDTVLSCSPGVAEQVDVDRHLMLSYAYESAFLRESLRLEQSSAPVEHQRVSNDKLLQDTANQAGENDELWALYSSDDTHQRKASCDSSVSSGSSTTARNASMTSPCSGEQEEDEIKPFVVSWTEEVQHLSKLAASLRRGRGSAAWKLYLATPASDESIEIMRDHLAQKWGTKPRAEWVDELISIMQSELSGLKESTPADDKALANRQAQQPDSQQTQQLNLQAQQPHSQAPQPSPQAEQLNHILSHTNALIDLIKVLGFSASLSPPTVPSTQPYDEFIGAISVLLTQAPEMAHSLQDTRKRLAARDEYLNATVGSSAREMNSLNETISELQTANQELTDELHAERAGRRCVERELVRLQNTAASHRTKHTTATRNVDSKPAAELAALMSEFKKMSARVETLERERQLLVGSPTAFTGPRTPKPRIFTRATANITDKLDSPTPPASPPQLGLPVTHFESTA